MNSTTTLPSVFDVNALTSLKTQVKSNDPEALRAAAKQFEALFLQMVLKSMRDATPREGLFDNDQSRMYESLLDQQLSQVMSSKRGLGLAAVIERQLSRQGEAAEVFEKGLPLNPTGSMLPLDASTLSRLSPQARSALMAAYGAVSEQSNASERAASNPVAAAVASAYSAPQSGDVATDFVARVRPYALAVEQQSGIPAHFMVAQAALETGWGRAEPRFADGRTSFNLFGIKAGRNWQGATVEASTTEYVDGQAQRQTERFRAYNSYAEAFSDYARLLTTSPRYSQVIGTSDGASFARALQSAGYATDPQYAAKLERIIAAPALRDLTRT
ncbi:MAG: flagellar assembly peptidoglycan hydrolase FlgJ [Rhodocyclaceae bacterium]|nr:flagellar assembly peptidoglycan hydrolase FlgJ [Rhodocyclaceae bacterium]